MKTSPINHSAQINIDPRFSKKKRDIFLYWIREIFKHFSDTWPNCYQDGDVKINILYARDLTPIGYNYLGICFSEEKNIVIAGKHHDFIHTIIHELVHMRQFIRCKETSEKGVNGAATQIKKAMVKRIAKENLNG